MMTLNEVLEFLDGCDPDLIVKFEFGTLSPTWVNSWRGIYAEPALGYHAELKPVTVSALQKELREALNKTCEGWKGGEYTYDGSETLHIDNPGDCTHTEIDCLRKDNYTVYIKTYKNRN